MKWRKITEAEVKQAFESPEHTTPYQLDPQITNIFKHIGKRYLRVSYKREENRIIVVSAVDKND